jgi:hypothetical protein
MVEISELVDEGLGHSSCSKPTDNPSRCSPADH